MSDDSDPDIPAHLRIPSHLIPELLPARSLSVLCFLQYPLPVVSKAKGNINVRNLLSKNEPTVDTAEELRSIPIPDCNIVEQLGRDVALEPPTRSSSSVIALHMPNGSAVRLPLWIITYWKEVLHLRGGEGPYGAWLEAERWVIQRRTSWGPSVPKTSYLLINNVLTMLSSLPWSANLSGFSNAESMVTLSRYLSRNWLTDIHENQLLDLLRRKLLRRTEGLGIELETTYFWRSLKSAFEQNDREGYQERRTFSRPRGIGELLVEGERQKLGLLVNRNNTHWVAVVVDFTVSEVLVGDSLGDDPDPELVAVINWWLACHSTTAFSWKSLPITHQKDAHSCGALSWNALAHHLLPDDYPLSGHSRHDTDNLRMRALLEIARQHLDAVSCCHHFKRGPKTDGVL